jgi:hypothetical protein
MDDIRGEHDSSLTERDAERAPEAPDQPPAPRRRRIGPESEVRSGPEAPKDPDILAEEPSDPD